MAWRDQLQPGSYNGIRLSFEADEAAFGRRVQVHEYPQRDKPFVEDLGRKARAFSLECFLVGDDYMDRRDALIAELEKPGPGTLVHPYYGTLRVTLVEQGRIRHSSREGGLCTITLSFVEGGERRFPSVRADTVSQLTRTADAAIEGLGDDLAGSLVTGGMPGFLLDAALELLGGGLSELRQLNGRVNASVGTVSAISASIDDIANNLVSLLSTPGALVADVAGVMGSIFSTGTRVADVLSGYRRIRDSARAYEAVTATTPARQQQADNQSAIGRVFRVAAVVEAARTVTEMSPDFAITSNTQSPFDSLDEAKAVRDELLQDMDTEAAEASDDLYRLLTDLQHKLIAHIKAHGQTLARIAYVTLPERTPSLVLAHRLYGNIDLELDIVRRNAIANPAFVPAGRPIEYLVTSSTVDG